MNNVWRYTARMMVVMPFVFSGVTSVPEAGTHDPQSEVWDDNMCRAIGCPNNSELFCAEISGTREIAIVVLGFRFVIDEEEFTIECTQGRP